MADFHWDDSHVEWFLEAFSNNTKEISGRDVEKRYRPKKGEPKKGRPIDKEATITTEDFRSLMRLMVEKGNARAVCSYSNSSKYRIRMVSEKYPYTSDLFDEDIFSHPFLIEPMPEPIDLYSLYGVPPTHVEWDSENLAQWGLVAIEGFAYRLAFMAYNNKGGDFDLVFDFIENTLSPYIFNDKESKELFILNAGIFIAMYRLYKAGKIELLDHAINNPAQTIGRNDPPCGYIRNYSPESIGNYKNIFIDDFRSNLIKDFLVSVDRRNWPERSVSDETYYKSFRLHIRSVEQNKPTPTKVMKVLKTGDYSDETKYWISRAIGRNMVPILRKSQKTEIVKAIAELDKAINDRENFKLTCNSKSVGKVRI